jgi:hypothetical protein
MRNDRDRKRLEPVPLDIALIAGAGSDQVGEGDAKLTDVRDRAYKSDDIAFKFVARNSHVRAH